VKRMIPLLLLILLPAGCSNAGEDLGFGVGQAPGLDVVVYFDRDWTGDSTSADTTRGGVTVSVVGAQNNLTVAQDTTNAQGLVRFRSLDPGYYRIVVDSAVLGDTIVATPTRAVDTLTPGGGTPLTLVGLAPPLYTIPEIRAGDIGKIVLATGTVTAGRQNFTDRSTFIRDAGAGGLRLLHGSNTNGNSFNDPGDIVRVRGRITALNGVRVLDSVRIRVVDSRTEYPPDTLTTAAAASAAAGVRDARLIYVANAAILDTGTVGGQFQVGLDDGSGRVVFQLDTLVSKLTSPFAPGKHVAATGALAAVAPGLWQVWPRYSTDYVIQ
jgi:hypothetical protein